MTKGIDLCCQQGTVDWQKVKAEGIDFIIPREGRGVNLDDNGMDVNFLEYVEGAKSVGIEIPGVYHFIYVHSMEDALKNAQKAVENVQKANLPQSTVIWCDQEEQTVIDAVNNGFNLTTDLQYKVMQIFCDYVLAQGYCTGVYLNSDYLHRVYGEDIVKQYDIWFADPYNQSSEPCLIKQTDWWGRVNGISVNVDLNQWEGTYTAGTAKQRGKDMSRIVYKEKELTDILIKLASGNPPSSYSNVPPKNLLYWDGSRWWADCVNLYKALFNGRSIVNPKTGSFQSDLSNTGDVTEWGLMQQCTDRSSDFTKLGNHFRCLYKDGHFGGYLGFEMEVDGQGIINAVESTPRWEDGIQYSYVDSSGGRRWAKGKTVDGYWTVHGLATPWIDYSGSDVKPAPTPTKTNHLTLAKFLAYLGYVAKGSTGEIVLMLQTILKDLGYYDGYLDGDCGDYTVSAIKAIQTDWHKSNADILIDGSFGTQSFTELLK